MADYKAQARSLKLEAMHQRNRFSHFILAKELEEAADSITALTADNERLRAELERKTQRPTQFDRITASPEAMAAFLASLPCLDAPWDTAFHRHFCDTCPLEDCPQACPHEAKRNSPAWWLGLEVSE